MTNLIQDLRVRLDKCVEYYLSQVRLIRGSGVTAGLVDTIRVPYHGEDVPVQALGHASPRGDTIVITLYDRDAAAATLKAVTTQGLTAYIAAGTVVVSVPRPTTETLERNRKRIRELAEEAKISARSVRAEFRGLAKGLTADEAKRAAASIQEALDWVVARIEADSKDRQANL